MLEVSAVAVLSIVDDSNAGTSTVTGCAASSGTCPSTLFIPSAITHVGDDAFKNQAGVTKVCSMSSLGHGLAMGGTAEIINTSRFNNAGSIAWLKIC